MNRRITPPAIAALAAVTLGAAPVMADDFIISTPVTTQNGGNTLDGDDSITVTGTGSVTTTAVDGYALYATGTNNTLANNGIVVTSGLRGYGLYHFGASGTLSNSGTVITTGTTGHGLYHFGDSGTLSNSGTVITSGNPGYGLYHLGDNGTLSNSGIVTTSGATAYGLTHLGANGTISNSGTVTTSGTTSVALYHFGANGTIINSGTVTTSGVSGHALSGSGADSNFTNSGTISTTGTSAFGILSQGANSTLNTTGTITTAGVQANGIFVTGSDGLTINTGTIVSSGLNASGFVSQGLRSTLTNSGLISTGGTGLYSVNGASQNFTLNLNQGSVLIGDVNFGDPTSAKLNFGPGLSAVVQTNALPNTITAPNGAYTTSGTTIYTTDITGFAAAGAAAAAQGRQVLDAIDQRGDNEVAVTRGPQGGYRWAQAIGGGMRDPGSDTTAAWWSGTAGAVVGYDDGSGAGTFAGLTLGRTATSARGFSTNTAGLVGGIYRDTKARDFSLSTRVGFNDNARSVAALGGLETASARYLSVEVSPSVTFKNTFGPANSDLRLRYVGQWTQGYTETGSTANLTVDNQLSHIAEARYQVSHHTESGQTFRFGTDLSYQSGSATSFTLAGNQLSAANAGNGVNGRGFVGAGFATKRGFGSAEVGISATGQVSGTAAFKINF